MQESRADGVETGVRLVEQDDLGVEHESPRQAGTLLHPTRDLARELLLGPLEPHHRQLLVDDVGDLFLTLPGVLAEGERDVVEDVHRSEERSVLEEDAELAADLVQLFLAEGGNVLVPDPDLAPVGLQQADEVLQEHALSGSRRGPASG